MQCHVLQNSPRQVTLPTLMARFQHLSTSASRRASHAPSRGATAQRKRKRGRKRNCDWKRGEVVLLRLWAAPPQASLLERTAVGTLWNTTRPIGPRSTQPPAPAPQTCNFDCGRRWCFLCSGIQFSAIVALWNLRGLQLPGWNCNIAVETNYHLNTTSPRFQPRWPLQSVHA